MWKFIKKQVPNFLSDRKGNMAVITAVALPTVLSMTGFAVDYSNLLTQRQSLQSVVDAAALGAAGILNEDNHTLSNNIIIDQAKMIVESQRGEIQLTMQPSIIQNSANFTIFVSAEAEIENFFGSVLGNKKTKISASSTATYAEFENSLNPNALNPNALNPNPTNISPLDGDDDEVFVEPISVMFVLDASGSMSSVYGGAIDNSDGRYNSIGTIRRDNVLNVEVEAIFDQFDQIQALYPEANEEIRTGVLAFNKGIMPSRSSNLQAGWNVTRTNAIKIDKSDFTLPATAFEEAMRQLNTDGPTNTKNARKAIVFIGDGELDDHARIFYDKPESEVLSGLCTQAKDDGIEVYVSTLDLDEEAAVDIYRQCASANGSIEAFSQDQRDIDQACMNDTSSQGRAACDDSKSDFFFQTKSAEDLQDFFKLLPKTIGSGIISTPDDDNDNDSDANSLIFKARLVK